MNGASADRRVARAEAAARFEERPESDRVHWRSVASNPNAADVRRHVRATCLSLRRGRIDDTQAFLRSFVDGRTVLDVGAVQHTLSQIERPQWKHRLIRAWARRTVGIDVLAPEVQELARRGFDVRLVDATSDVDLGERFERIVVGDVIEHVDSPVALLRFCQRHLAAGGKVLCSTPNPFFVTYLAQSLRHGVFVANAEHVAWISPSMALELGHRSDLRLTDYWHVQGPGRTPMRRLAVVALTLLGLRDAELFTGSFYYIYGDR